VEAELRLCGEPARVRARVVHVLSHAEPADTEPVEAGLRFDDPETARRIERHVARLFKGGVDRD
jgi:hypothetical protein